MLGSLADWTNLCVKEFSVEPNPPLARRSRFTPLVILSDWRANTNTDPSLLCEGARKRVSRRRDDKWRGLDSM